MATTEKSGLLTHIDASGNKTILYPVTIPDAVDGLAELLAAKAPAGHATDKNNPHGVTADQVGATPASHATDKNNPHGVTAAQAGALSLEHITDGEHLIPEGDDLDNYTTPGVYRVSSVAIAGSLYNMPAYKSSAFRLIVSNTSSSSGFVQIIIFNTDIDRIYYRVRHHGGNWGVWKRFVGHEVGAKEELWSGSWSSGTITVPNTDKYKAFLIAMDGVGTLIIAFSHNTHVRGIGGYVSNASSVMTYQFTAKIDGNDWTFVGCNGMDHPGGTVAGKVVTEIIGLL